MFIGRFASLSARIVTLTAMFPAPWIRAVGKRPLFKKSSGQPVKLRAGGWIQSFSVVARHH
jgi:hypothetical protein